MCVACSRKHLKLLMCENNTHLEKCAHTHPNTHTLTYTHAQNETKKNVLFKKKKKYEYNISLQ